MDPDQGRAANITEGLALGILRDEAILDAILKNRKAIASVRDEIVERERIGLMQAGSSDDVAAVVNSIDQGYSSILSAISDEKMALAQAAGFFNSAAVSEVSDSAAKRPWKARNPMTIRRLKR